MIFLRRLVHRVARLSGRHLVPIVAGFVFISVDSADLASNVGSPVLFVVGCVAVLYGVIDIGYRMYRDWQRLGRFYERPRLTHVPIDYEEPYSRWRPLPVKASRMFPLVWGTAITSPELNEQLVSGKTITVVPDSSMWKPPGEGEVLRRLLRVQLDSDDQKIRLNTDLLASTSEVTLQRTHYSAFVVTNRLGAYELWERGRERELLDAPSVILRGDLLPRLSTSRCSNHLGVDVLGVTSDGRILLTLQSMFNELSGDLIAPSGSGSVDWSDLKPGDDLVGLIARAMCREMCEELGLDRRHMVDRMDVRLLGYARLNHLAGKPQFFGVARLPVVEPSIVGREKRYADDHLVITYDPLQGTTRLEHAIAEFVDRYGERISFPLAVNLYLLSEWLGTAPGEAMSWLHPDLPLP